MINKEILKILNDNKDLKYKEFNDKIINTKLQTIGVRTPIIKKLSKEISKNDVDEFLNNVKSDYYEEVLLEGFVISNIKDVYLLIDKIDKFINKIDNWAICDLVNSNLKAIKKDKEYVLGYIKNNIKSNNIWKVRFLFVTLLNYFVEEKYLNIIFDYVENDTNNEYYVMMAKAWLISMCYIKYKDITLDYLKKTNIDKITYNKTISKICDSKRVSINDKIMLKKMKK